MCTPTSLQQAIDRLLPDPPSLVEMQSVGGGCISQATRAVVQSRSVVQSKSSRHSKSGEQSTLFVKSNSPSFLDNFRCEQEGLRRLADAGTIRVPRPIACGEAAGRAWLILEWIDQATPEADFFPAFGRQLAELHRATRGRTIGLDHDNFLGSARQPNRAAACWTEFVADRRLGFQLRWASDQGLADGMLRRDVDQIIRRLPELLEGRDDLTSLLHGDLWSGNYLSDLDGRPVILDPAVYHGCREAEFGMLHLFGACPPTLEEAYQSVWPMPDGWQQRTKVYVLYHLLNHLNLFGLGYAGQCRSLAAEILRHQEFRSNACRPRDSLS